MRKYISLIHIRSNLRISENSKAFFCRVFGNHFVRNQVMHNYANHNIFCIRILFYCTQFSFYVYIATTRVSWFSFYSQFLRERNNTQIISSCPFNLIISEVIFFMAPDEGHEERR